MLERNIKIFGGMTGEFEIIKTNAPDSVIIEELNHYGCNDNPYSHITKYGYNVDVVGCHDDEISKSIIVDKEFDLYDFI